MELKIVILTLVSGEEVICNLKDHIEQVDGKDTKVCYNMTYPFVLSRSGPIQNQQVGVTFTPWKFFSIDTSFLVGYDKIINMCSPLPNVIEQYKQAVDAQIRSMAEQQQQ